MLEINLTKRDAYKAYHNVLIPKIGYTSATTTMTEKELKGMQVMVDKVIPLVTWQKLLNL